ncbi:mangetout isoform X2 [Amblyomma americanum]
MARVVLLAPVLQLLLLARQPPPAGCADLDKPAEVRVPVWPVKRAAVLEGDVVLGGLMMVHEREDQLTCGKIMPQGGIQALECMLFTLDWVNRQPDLFPFALGAYVLDDCDKDTYGLELAVDFIKGSMGNIDDGAYRCPDGSSPERVKQTVISGVLGAASSVTSIQVANLLRLFKIPQVSFFSTSPELSNKQRFEFFLRTVPSDKNQAHAMVEIVKLLKWTYVSILYEESNYGLKAFNELEEQLRSQNICIAVKEKLTKDSGVAAEGTYDTIIQNLRSKQRARGVIVFGSDQEVAGVMRAVRRNNATGHFAWIGSDGWSARELVSDGNEPQVEGTLSVQPRAHEVEGFDQYFRALTPETNRRNPWFIEFWEHFFRCKWNNSLVTPFNQRHPRNCTGRERISDNKSYKLEGQLQFVSDAVLAFAYALLDMHRAKCGKTKGLCESMRPVNGTELLAYLQRVQFKGLSGDEFRFSAQGDGPARYNILHFKQVEPGKYRWMPVGKYHDGTLHLDLAQLQFQLGSTEIPRSVCSDPCPRGSAQRLVEGEQCCWHCVRCSGYTFAAEGGVCADCAPGTLPDAHHERCLPVPESHMSPDSPLAVATLALAAVGSAFTFATLAVFVRHIDTPVVRASGRELCCVLLAGIVMCQATALLLVQRPSVLVCGAQRAALGLCFAVVYAAILAKTDRIARIFRAGRRSAQRPGCISPRSQLALCGALVSVQALVAALWLALRPPRAVHHHPTREDNQLVCLASVQRAGYALALAYPLCLVAVCTVYAVLTRKIPEAFNESKYIGFAMYTTCIIWLAFLPIYLTTWRHVNLNLTSMAMAVSLSGTVTLICLFFPKLYIIVLHPEKNVRQSIMAKYGTLKNRVESATQSDDYEMSDKQRSACSLVSTNSRASCATQTDEHDFWDMDVQL